MLRGLTAPADRTGAAPAGPSRRVAITALGIGQILAWGSSYYLPAVLAQPIADDTGWPLPWVVGGLSLGLLASGVVSPRMGRAIEHRGGRPVLALSALLLAAGLAGIAAAPNVAVYMAAWAVIGLGMGAGLYDPAFATLGRLYGQEARTAISTLTLFGGFASTVCWPLSAALVETVGWRGACLAYAAIHLAIVLPLYLFGVPREERRDVAAPISRATSGREGSARRNERPLFILLATVLTLGAAISTVLSVHLLTILQARDIGLAAAVAFGALVGPSQVGARVLERLTGGRWHPIWTMVASACLVTAGLGMLLSGLPVIAAGLVFYGAGVGIKSIARGTLPLALFGTTGYAALMGRLATPSLIAQAIAPSLGAVLLDHSGATGILAALTGAALVNLALVLALLAAVRRTAPLPA